MQTLFNSIKAWIKQPFSTRMNLWQYAALVGLTMIIVILWTRVLAHVEAEI